LNLHLSCRYVGVSDSPWGLIREVLGFCLSSVSPRRARFGICLLAFSFLTVSCTSYSPSSKTPTTSLSLSATTFDFKTVVVGQTGTQTLQISNSGTAPLQIASLSISNKEFSIKGSSLPSDVLPGASVSFSISFKPTSAGSVSATLTIESNATDPAPPVSLAGTGEKAFANLVVTPTSINFGNLTLKSKTTHNVTLQNTGDINLTVQGITVAGAGFGYADLSPGFSLAPNQKVTFQVWFSPTVAGPASARVSFISPNLSSPDTLSLSGTGVTTTSSSPTPSQHTVHLTWGPSVSPVIGYIVYRGEVSGSYAPLYGTALDALTYDDSTVVSGTTYYYVVTAVDASGEQSVYSNQAAAAVPSP
jgi:HYDIN/CFA65/VesB family protein